MRYSYEIGPIRTRPRTFFERLRKASCLCRRNGAANHDHYLEMSNRIFGLKTLAETLRAKDEQSFQFQLKIPKKWNVLLAMNFLYSVVYILYSVTGLNYIVNYARVVSDALRKGTDGTESFMSILTPEPILGISAMDNTMQVFQ